MEPLNLDRALIELVSQQEVGHWTIRHALEGVQIFGGIGSGKTSGSGRMLALKYLNHGFGGLVLTVKPDEKQAWQEYCQLTRREKDLIILEPGGQHVFNFLDYESTHASGEKALTDNMVQVLKTVIRAGEEKDAGKSDDAFWENALDMLIYNVIDLCQLAYDKVSVQAMYDLVMSIPKSTQEMQTPSMEGQPKAFQQALEGARERVMKQIDDWESTLTADERSRWQDGQALEQMILDTFPEARLLKYLDSFFIDNYITLSDKTRSIIDFLFSSFLFRLLREPVYSLFCRHTSTFTPEDCLRGKIILINLPVKLFHKVGRDCQILFKYIWQRAMEKRDVSQNGRPVFLWADEAQHFLHEHDADYQATARSSRICTVYISQNMPNYYASMGGHKAEYRVKSFLGTLGTKIFHANADIETNKYASELIGDVYFEEKSESVTVAQNFSQTHSKSLKLERVVRPEEFVRLRTGGPLNHFRVEGYLHRQGDRVFKGFNHVRMTFSQLYHPTSNS